MGYFDFDWGMRATPHPKTIKCPECFKPLGQDDAYGHDCEV